MKSRIKLSGVSRLSNFTHSIFQLGFLALMVVQGACSKGSDNPGVPQIQNCADNSPRCCPGCNPDMSMGALKAAAAGASMSFQNADAALKNVEALRSKEPSGISQLASAATAKDLPGLTTPGNNAPPSLGDTSEARKNGGSRGGLGAGGSGGGGAMELSVKKTGPSEFTGTKSAATGLQDGGAYSGGGGAGARGGGWSTGGEVAITGARATHGEFGNGAGVNPMGSEDPMDYFARLSLGDSLFKIVERRYQAKQVSWKQGDESIAISKSRRP
jgi:hypothetical protein